MSAKSAKTSPESTTGTKLAMDIDSARTRVAETGRNDACPCGSGKKYKKCHLLEDQAAASPPAGPPDPMEHVQAGWRLFEQRRPGAAEKEFRAALALKAELPEAQVGVGLAKLSAGDSAGAREALDVVVKGSEPLLKDLEKQGATDGFSRKEAQPVLRACHALGCLAYDDERYEDALSELGKVFAVDAGPVGTEARLITGKTLVKLGRPADAVPVLEPATKSDNGPGRAYMGLALANFLKGDEAAAKASLGQALEANAHFVKALLGQFRKQVDNPLGAPPGSREEAAVYAQTYGDVWDDKSKEFLARVLEAGAEAGATPPSSATEGAGEASPG
jgi:tetratricopeptide (TPR) repeat protein